MVSIMTSQYPCLADLLSVRSEGGEVGEVTPLLLGVPTRHHGVDLHRLDPVLLGHTHSSVVSQHSGTASGFPLDLTA